MVDFFSALTIKISFLILLFQPHIQYCSIYHHVSQYIREFWWNTEDNYYSKRTTGCQTTGRQPNMAGGSKKPSGNKVLAPPDECNKAFY